MIYKTDLSGIGSHSQEDQLPVERNISTGNVVLNLYIRTHRKCRGGFSVQHKSAMKENVPVSLYKHITATGSVCFGLGFAGARRP